MDVAQRERGVLPGIQPSRQGARFAAVILCAFVAFFDGFDTQAVGPAGPSIVAALHLHLGALGAAFSAAQVGFLFGAFTCAPLGDRFSRKQVLLASMMAIAIAALGTATAHSFPQLLFWRVVSGLGLGGATPNFISIAAEFSPAAIRARVVTLLWAAVPLGGIAGSLTSAVALAHHHWQFAFYVGFAAPLVLVLVMWVKLPNSSEHIKAQPGKFIAHVVDLFATQAWTTLWLWLTSFMLWMMLIVSAYWTAPLMKLAGFSPASAATLLAFFNVGGIVGTIGAGLTIGKLRPHQVLLFALPISGIFLILLAFATSHTHSEFTFVAFAEIFVGFFELAAGGAILGLSAELYPGEIRATGVGWALSVGRLGSIVGPSLVGTMVSANWQVSSIFFALAVPAFLAFCFVLFLSKRVGPPVTQETCVL